MQTEHRVSKKLAAMKRVPIQDDTELDDFMVEIDILAECKHPNIVGLHEAYFYDQALWVSMCPQLGWVPGTDCLRNVSVLTMYALTLSLI